MFRPGDRVRFLNDVGEGVVVQMTSANEVLIRDESDFEYTYPAAELILIPDPEQEAEAYQSKKPTMHEMLYRNVDEEDAKKAQRNFKAKYNDRKAEDLRYRGEVVEVDLHIHELVPTEAGLDPAAMLDIQMRHFERMMRRAERERIARIVFIHGIGQGVLRAEIRKQIEEFYPNASFSDARYEDYGYGATEVRLRFN